MVENVRYVTQSEWNAVIQSVLGKHSKWQEGDEPGHYYDKQGDVCVLIEESIDTGYEYVTDVVAVDFYAGDALVPNRIMLAE